MKKAITSVILGIIIAILSPVYGETNQPLRAKWIWKNQKDYNQYNQTIIARKTFTIQQPRSAVLKITADSYYRLFINGVWVNDGPCRSWFNHYQYDVIDVENYLVSGKNEIYVIARYFGVGDFHRIPQQAGLLAQLEIEFSEGKRQIITTDSSWEVAEAAGWIRNTPKVSIQMEPAEYYDARLEGNLKFSRAKELFEAEAGPWKNLNPRDVALLTKQPVNFKTYGGANIVRAEALNFCLPAARLVNPGVIEANHNASCACGMATIVEVQSNCVLNIQVENFKVSVDGKPFQKGQIELGPGRHLLLAFVRNVTGHDKEKSLRFYEPRGFKLVNPLRADYENPFVFIRFNEFAFATNDLRWFIFTKEDKEISGKIEKYNLLTDEWLRKIKTDSELLNVCKDRCELMPSEKMFVQDWMWQFYNRKVIRPADDCVESPYALMHNTPDCTIIKPSKDGDVELMYDLGEQDIGYYRFEMIAPAGVIFDVYGVEYISPDGRIQHTWGNRNTMRYVTREGINTFTSLKRRSGRYLFLTFRNLTAPVKIRNFQLIESTYPLNYIGSFSCSDARLENIWEISTRTLKLCMEDTFTDCPLYEQTHWVGDARNESLLAYSVFDSRDIGRRCIMLTAQSLERLPFAGCQTPSSWDVLIPAWSFLWGISVYDYYFYSGDTKFLKQVYPYVIQNLKGAEKYINKDGLFSGPFWNFFDWTGIDSNQKTVTHNSMLMIGAIEAALKVSEAINDKTYVQWLEEMRRRLTDGVNKLYDKSRGAYVDSVREDGSLSPSVCQHTSFLALLYDIAPQDYKSTLIQNLTNPPDKMVKVGSPFAMLYLYETLEKLGMQEQIVEEIYRNYLPMLEAGATTVWESFPSGTTGSGGFPTRSHCHAWSSAPTYYLNRIVLGVVPIEPAGAKVRLSPYLCGLQWAKGAVATANGVIAVSWRLKGDNTVEINYKAPQKVVVEFARNKSLDGKTIILNGEKL
ncbi:MAG: alpha-L-rhamnosidase N-terminal domain-containing protein [Verrucomicrobiia bacterium]